MISSRKTNIGGSAALLSLAIAAASQGAYAQSADCSYTVNNDWGSGFTGTVEITNTGSTAINGWNVNWQYDNNSLQDTWNANVSGANPYSASNLSWNSSIQPGQSVSFGFKGDTNGTSAETVQVTGDVCSDTGSSSSASSSSSSSTSSSSSSSSSSSTTSSSSSSSSSSVGDVGGTFRVDDNGEITQNGDVFPVQCSAWFGLEGQHEPPDAANNPDGAPMELYVGNMWWHDTGRTIQQTMTEITAQGINTIRLPIAPQTLDPNDPQGTGDIQSGGVLKNHESVRQDNARQALEDFIVQADQNDINVIIDIHSCSNYVGWRAGQLDATPPYADADRDNYEFTREGYSCAPVDDDSVTVHAYNETLWLEDLREIASLSDQLGVDNIMAIDIFNEPWDYTWAEWSDLAENAYDAISEVNDDVLVMVEGIAGGTSEGTDVPHGAQETNPNWGENLYPFQNDPLDIPKERLILSPHTYGPSVFVQKQFMDPGQPECEGLEGDEAGDAGCNIVIDPARLEPGWEEHFGYLRDQGYAMIIGEFGGFLDWPQGAPERDQDRWDHIQQSVDEQWQNALVDYMVEKDIQGCYWSTNPESTDTGGLYNHAYDPITNEDDWGLWEGFNQRKWNLLDELWNGTSE